MEKCPHMSIWGMHMERVPFNFPIWVLAMAVLCPEWRTVVGNRISYLVDLLVLLALLVVHTGGGAV